MIREEEEGDESGIYVVQGKLNRMKETKRNCTEDTFCILTWPVAKLSPV